MWMGTLDLKANKSSIVGFFLIPMFIQISLDFQMATQSIVNKRGLAYQCLRCGKIDQRNRIKTHIYREHVERGNVPFMCSLCSFFTDTYSGLEGHKNHQTHKSNVDRLEGSHKSESFIVISGESAVFLREGHDYKALSSEVSEREWSKRAGRSRTVADGMGDLLVITAPTVAEPLVAEPLVAEEYPDFEDLVTLDEQEMESVFPTTGQRPTASVPAVFAARTPASPPPPSPVARVESPTRPASPAPSSSSSSSSGASTVQIELLREISKEISNIRTAAQLHVDVLRTLNKTIEDNNRVQRSLLDFLRSRRRSRSPVRRGRSPSPKRYRRN